MAYIIGKVFGCGLADFGTSLMIYERKFKFYTRALSKTDLVRTWGQSPFLKRTWGFTGMHSLNSF
jgi:hypothetical protein